ncbi:MAG TPA: hypothetical protein VHM01_01155 [Alphaproteobacteria bacterium]|nr:hypothetical protein [Alphaproteobacteria bacterium]
MILMRALAVLAAAAFAAPVIAAPAAAPVQSGERFVLVQGEEQGKKKAKGKNEAKKNADRSNKGGETRGAERVDQVQGMQDTGKGAGKRKQ